MKEAHYKRTMKERGLHTCHGFRAALGHPGPSLALRFVPMQLRLVLNPSFFCFSLPCPGILGVCHQAQLDCSSCFPQFPLHLCTAV